MENKLFENAKFGDKFVTRDGQMAIYVAKHEERDYYGGAYKKISHTYALENRCTVHWCKDNGVNLSFIEDFDIVGRWQEPIDEDYLNNLANAEYPLEDGIEEAHWNTQQSKLREAYKSGYRKAKRDNNGK